MGEGTPAECGSETAEDFFYKDKQRTPTKRHQGFPGVKIKVR